MSFGTSKKIILDLYNNKYVSTRVAQNDIDSREIIIQVTNDGKPYPIDPTKFSVKIKYHKTDGNIVLNDILEEDILSDGTIRLVLSEQMCTSFGRNEAELMLIDVVSMQVIHTMNFIVNVKKSTISNEEITSKDEFTTLENALLKVETLYNFKDEFLALNDALEKAETLPELRAITTSEIDSLWS
ncbi:MAG: BppU family phage baseplate upper protein [Lachnospiraceae bacterium]|nr:BppU family phage baseplate upper protein [Lachnospiraceae bacterium]